MRQTLLSCGVAASLLYVVMTIAVPMHWPAYSSFSQTVSELSAIDAPTRSLWVPFGLIYTLLVVAFGWGVWASARSDRRLRVVGGVLIVNGALGLAWPPMHLRTVLAAGGGTLTDSLHIAFAIANVVLMLLAIGFGAAALGRSFRVYSIVTIVILLVCGALTTVDAPGISTNTPTPWVGMWERINIGAYLLWVIVFAAILLRGRKVSNTP